MVRVRRCELMLWQAGAMEALEKGYLSSLMFIIYLDENRPDE